MQEHLLQFYDELPKKKQAILKEQINNIDFDYIQELTAKYVTQKPTTDIPDNIAPAPYYPLTPKDDSDAQLYADAYRLGEQLIANGEVAVLTVAGGQGTRLGFDGPKGTYPITPVKNKSFFQYFAETILGLEKKYNTSLTWYIMTSILNDAPTRQFFKDNNFFGLKEEQLFFFPQGTMPVIGYDGKLLLADKGELALAPDGHGGTLLALRTSGALDKLKKDGIKYLSYIQIDNALVSLMDPLFIGMHVKTDSEMSARMLAKTGPHEKLGNFCLIDDHVSIIEYSDLPEELAIQTNSDGSLRFLAGSPAIHILSCDFVESLTATGRLELPWHRADKKVPYIDSTGTLIKPDVPNAVKLETFIFDALPLAKRTMILEADRKEEFSPTKNPTGVDSVESCRKMISERDARRLEVAGVSIPRKEDGTLDCVIEISTKRCIDTEDVIAYVKENNIQHVNAKEKVYFK
jgi:UDP-N-acetylglucosamine/UDP-N-acetylgalactosamine diphosphorylase